MRTSKIYEPVNKCIYCLSTNNLSDEHIIPFALGGTDILPKSSCTECNKITSYIEGQITKNALYPYRLAKNIKSRKRKTPRPSEISLKVKYKTDFHSHQIPIAEHPAPIFFPIYPEMPGILNGRPTDCKWNSVKIGIWLRDLNTDLLPSGDVVIKLETRINTLVFARMLAKIAHTAAVANYGLGSFHPFLPDIILGKSDHAPQYVGTEYLPPRPAISSALHILETRRGPFGFLPNVIAAKIQLFVDVGTMPGVGPVRWNGTPTYWVIVGTIL